NVFFAFNTEHLLVTNLKDCNHTVHRGHDSFCLRVTGFEEFFNTRKTLGNVSGRCYTSSVEGTHGELSTRFTDTLSGDNTNGFTNLNQSSTSKVFTVTLLAD